MKTSRNQHPDAAHWTHRRGPGSKMLSLFLVLLLLLSTFSLQAFAVDKYQYTGTNTAGAKSNTVRFNMTGGYYAYCVDKNVVIKKDVNYLAFDLEDAVTKGVIPSVAKAAKVRAILNKAWNITAADKNEITAIQYALWNVIHGSTPPSDVRNNGSIYPLYLNYISDTVTPPIYPENATTPNPFTLNGPATPNANIGYEESEATFAFTADSGADIAWSVFPAGSSTPLDASRYTLTYNDSTNSGSLTIRNIQDPGVHGFTVAGTTLNNTVIHAKAFIALKTNSSDNELNKNRSQTVVGVNLEDTTQTKDFMVTVVKDPPTSNVTLTKAIKIGDWYRADDTFTFEVYSSTAAAIDVSNPNWQPVDAFNGITVGSTRELDELTDGLYAIRENAPDTYNDPVVEINGSPVSADNQGYYRFLVSHSSDDADVAKTYDIVVYNSLKLANLNVTKTVFGDYDGELFDVVVSYTDQRTVPVQMAGGDGVEASALGDMTFKLAHWGYMNLSLPLGQYRVTETLLTGSRYQQVDINENAFTGDGLITLGARGAGYSLYNKKLPTTFYVEKLVMAQDESTTPGAGFQFSISEMTEAVSQPAARSAILMPATDSYGLTQVELPNGEYILTETGLVGYTNDLPENGFHFTVADGKILFGDGEELGDNTLVVTNIKDPDPTPTNPPAEPTPVPTNPPAEPTPVPTNPPAQPTPVPTNPPTRPVSYVNLTVAVNGPGTATPGSGSQTRGAYVALTATPGEDAVFLGWTGPDGNLVTDNDQILMDADRSIIANFAIDEPIPEGAPETTPIPEPTPVPAPQTGGADDEVILDVEVPLDTPVLPKTGGLPLSMLTGFGVLFTATGLTLRGNKRKEKNED